MGLPLVCCKRADFDQTAYDRPDSRIGDPRRLINPGGFDKAIGCPSGCCRPRRLRTIAQFLSAASPRSLDEQHNLGSQIDTDDYNAKVNAHNALLARQRALIAANRADLKTYDDLIDQDSALVKQYNALLK